MVDQLLSAFGDKMIINPYRYAADGFLPSDLANLRTWYDSSDISTLWTTSARSVQVASLDDPVGAWDDKSGNGHHLLQATAGFRPTYKTTSGIFFDAANTEYLFDSAIRSSVRPSGTYFVVFNQDGLNNNGVAFCNSSNSSTVIYVVNVPNHDTVGSYTDARTRTSGDAYNMSTLRSGLDFDDSADHVQSTQIDINDNELWVDGISIDSETAFISEVTTLNRFAAGALVRNTIASFYTGYIPEIIYYDVPLSDADRQSVEAYLTSKWSI